MTKLKLVEFLQKIPGNPEIKLLIFPNVPVSEEMLFCPYKVYHPFVDTLLEYGGTLDSITISNKTADLYINSWET